MSTYFFITYNICAQPRLRRNAVNNTVPCLPTNLELFCKPQDFRGNNNHVHYPVIAGSMQNKNKTTRTLMSKEIRKSINTI